MLKDLAATKIRLMDAADLNTKPYDRLTEALAENAQRRSSDRTQRPKNVDAMTRADV